MKEVSLFIPCVVDLFMPEVGEACVTLLGRLGLEPVCHEEQTCCGQPAISAGYMRDAKKAAKHFIEVFESDEFIVCPSGSCVNTVKNRYPDLLRDEPEWKRRAENVAPRVYELSQFIVDVVGTDDVGASFEGKVAYHASCQLLRGLGISEQPKRLIRAARGAELVPMEGAEKCCGFGGEFANEYHEISEAMVSEKADNYLSSGADILVACDPGCLLNIGGYLSRNHPDKRVVHIASFLADGGERGRT